MQRLKPFYILWSTFTYINFLFFNKISLKYFVWLGQVLVVACMMQFSSQGSNSGSLHWKCGISTTGPQGKSRINFSSHPCSCCYCSVTKSCLTLCDPMDCSTPGFPVFHYLPEFAQTHVHWIGDAIQPSHPLSSASPPALNLSQQQGLFQWVGFSHQVAKVLELQHPSMQWIFRVDFL